MAVNVPLPEPPDRYDRENEAQTRAAIELAFSTLPDTGATGATGAPGGSDRLTQPDTTQLLMTNIADGDLLTRVGTNIEGTDPLTFAPVVHTHPKTDITGFGDGLVNRIINVVEDYGAEPLDPRDNTVPTEDSTTAFQDAIDACISTEDHKTTSRRAGYALYVPPGWYKVTDELKIRSVVGFQMIGAGMQITKLYGLGGTALSPIKAIIGLNGGSKCKFSGFSLEGESSSEYKYLWHSKYLHVDDFPTDADRVALGCSEVWFDNVEVVGRYRNAGFKCGNDVVGDGSGGSFGFGLNRQIDQHHFKGCRAYGQYAVTAPSATHWQAGWEIGTGAFSNPVIYSFDGCTTAFNKYGVDVQATDIYWRGGNPQTNYSDFRIQLGLAHFGRIEGTRSEESGYFLLASSTGSQRGLSIANCEFGLSQTPGQYDPDSTGFLINSDLTAPMSIENFSIFNSIPSGSAAKIRTLARSLHINGLTTPHAPQDAVVTSSGYYTLRNVHTYWEPQHAALGNGLKASYGEIHGGAQKYARQRGIVGMVDTSEVKARLVPSDEETWGVVGNLLVNGESLRVAKMAVPGAPALVASAVGVTSYTYYLVCFDAHGRTSGVGPGGTITTAPATLDVNNLVYIDAPTTGWPDGTVTVDVYKTNTSTRLAAGIPIEQFRVVDYGQATAANVAPTANATGGALSVEPHALTYGTSIATNASLGNYFTVTVTDNVAFTISNPTNPATGQVLTYSILNSSGGAMGAITWGSHFKMAGAFTNPANSARRSITFVYETTNTWVERGRAMADIA